MKLTLAQIAETLGLHTTELPALNKKSVGEAWLQIPSAVVIDSRKVVPGALFVCIKGNNVDGHDFAAGVAQAGACAILAERDPFAPGQAHIPFIPVLLCEDSVVALGKIARRHRQDMHGKVVAVTGTAGKTTVKEVLAQVLSQAGQCAKSHMNQNNQIGLPLSMLAASEEAAFWVMEAGISQPQDMDELGGILEPDYAVIINAGAGHVQGLGERGTPYHKASLLRYLTPYGEGLVSADYPKLHEEALATGRPVIFFSTLNDDVECRVSYLGPVMETTTKPTGVPVMEPTADSGQVPDHGDQKEVAGVSAKTLIKRGRYSVRVLETTFEVEAPFRGAFGAENVAAIAGAAIRLGLSVADVQAGFAEALLPEKRFFCTEFKSGILIDDSYNANPLSMHRMLSAAAELAEENSAALFLVLGAMLELGSESVAEHAELGLKIAGVGAKAVFWKGAYGENVLSALRASGWTGPFFHIDGPDDFMADLFAIEAETSEQNDRQTEPRRVVFLVKGSRGNKLEEISKALSDHLK